MSSPAGSPNHEPIIIVKKVVSHGKHHGGAWKVAYADFVTAMMALFIVLWLLGSSEKVQKTVGGYFRDPRGQGQLAGTTKSGAGEAMKVKPDDLSNLKKNIEKAMAREVKDFNQLKDYLNITITEEGLRIEFLESAKGEFFENGSANPTPVGANIFAKLAEQVGTLPNKVIIEGHTDAKPFSPKSGYSNWELSADRANAVRRLMQDHGLRSDQVAQVRGYASQQLRKPDAPDDPSNRRISILIRKVEPEPATSAAVAAPPPAQKPPQQSASAQHK